MGLNDEIDKAISEYIDLLHRAHESIAGSFYIPPLATEDLKIEIASSIHWAIMTDPSIKLIKEQIAYLYSI